MMMFLKFCALFVVCLSASTAWAWGERGHQLIARVAARLISDRGDVAQDRAGVLFLKKEYLLGHLANVPDTVWRNADEAVVKANAPTHYTNLESLFPEGQYEKFLGMSYDAAAQIIAKGPASQTLGTAPWRAVQLYTRMLNSADAARDAKGEGSKLTEAVDDALLNGGLMAHFVGDLAQPLHATSDYDAEAKGQGGLHLYFEEAVVAAIAINLEAEVYSAAKGGLGKTNKEYTAAEALRLIQELTVESHKKLPLLLQLDRKFAVTKLGQSHQGLKIPAERKDARLVAKSPAMRRFVIARLSAGAICLAKLWRSMELRFATAQLDLYRSFAYPLVPKFIDPNF